jgi:hypothetical protein
MNEQPKPNELVVGRVEPANTTSYGDISSIKPDAKQLRIEYVGKLLETAYGNASSLKLTAKESKALRADFPDEVVQLRPFDGVIYIPHMVLRERLWEVFSPGEIAEVPRGAPTIRVESNEVAVDLVLLIRGVAVAEAIGTAFYIAKNPQANYGDTVESAWSDALRRCCKKFGVGTQIWRPAYEKFWLETYGTKFQQELKDAAEKRKRKTRVVDPDWPEAPPAKEKDDVPF